MKIKLLILPVILITLLAFNPALYATDSISEDPIEASNKLLEDIDEYIFICNTKVSLDEINSYVGQNFAAAGVDSVTAYSEGFRKWITDKWAVGIELEISKAEWKNATDKVARAATKGYLGTVSYRFNLDSNKLGLLDKGVVKLGIGDYESEVEVFAGNPIVESDNGLGFKLNVGFPIPLQYEDVNMGLCIGYRRAKISIDNPNINDIDFSGFQVSTGVDFKF